MAPFPWTAISDLREKYTYDIHPFTTFRAERKNERKNMTRPLVKQQQHGKSLFTILFCLFDLLNKIPDKNSGKLVMDAQPIFY